MRNRIAIVALAALCLGAAGCGSSSSGIQQAPAASDNATAPQVPTTPTSGPLSTEPTIAKGTGAPPTHLVIKDLIRGTGPVVKTGQSLTVNYVGVLYSSGKIFDASWKRNQPFTFTVGQGVITGWSQGVLGMHVGGRRELIIPPALAYGKQGSPPTIGPNQTLIFDVDALGAQ